MQPIRFFRLLLAKLFVSLAEFLAPIGPTTMTLRTRLTFALMRAAELSMSPKDRLRSARRMAFKEAVSS